ncbi:hypothetical protein [Acidisphaera sp. L21]|uniref:hypothetical protein n=1 Tax=Acidisphaera sp. L21 TaxID=1641851 RepID=UPI00131BD397|nr:hypothetical protein [Acidisphaera sp. L21]
MLTEMETADLAGNDVLERRRPGRLAMADSELIPLMRRPSDRVSDEVRCMIDEDSLLIDVVSGPPMSVEAAEQERGVVLKVVLIICGICAFAMAV